jgi:hypothetical protein
MSVFEYGVLIRAWGADEEPGEARYKEYIVEASDEDEAKEMAVEEGKNSFTEGIIGRRDGYEVVEVECYGQVENGENNDGE